MGTVRAFIGRDAGAGIPAGSVDTNRKRSRTATFIGAALAVVVAGAVGVAFAVPSGTTYYVATTGSNSNDCLSSSAPCQTIAGAIGKAASGDTIEVAAGTYAGTWSYGLGGKNLTFKGAQAGVDARTRGGRSGAGTSSSQETNITETGRILTLGAEVVTIDGFRFTDARQRAFDNSGVSTNGLTVKNSIILSGATGANNGGVFQFASGASYTANDLTFDRNYIANANATTGGTSADGNILYFTNAADRGTISNNFINGLRFQFGPFGARTGWRVEGNEFDGRVLSVTQTPNGDRVGYGINANLGDVVVKGNKVTKMQIGLGQFSVVGGSIEGNTFDDNYGSAFQLRGGESGSVVSSNVQVKNNLIRYNGTDYTSDDAGFLSQGFRIRSNLPTAGPDSSSISVNNNRFVDLDGSSGKTQVWAIRNNGTGTVNAENNVWVKGSTALTDGSAIASRIGKASAPPSSATDVGSGLGDTSPWILSYTDDPDKTSQPGFWPTSVVSGETLSNSAVPTLSGTVRVGQTLTTTNGTWSGSPEPSSYTYKWQRSTDGSTGWADISGATSSTYVLQTADLSKYVRSVVTATNAAGGTAAQSAASSQVGSPMTVYVATNGSNSNIGTTADQPLASIPAALSAVAAGGTINVAAGEYSTSATGSQCTDVEWCITKSVTLLGAQAGVAPTGSARSGGETKLTNVSNTSNGTFVIKANNVSIKGFEFNGSQYAVKHNHSDGSISGLTVEDNWFHQRENTGSVFVQLNINSGGSNLTAADVTINRNYFAHSITGGTRRVVSFGGNSGSYITTYSNFAFTNNTVTDSTAGGSSLYFGGGSPSQYRINGFTMTGNTTTNSSANVGNILNGTVSNNTFNTAGGAYGIDTGTISGNTFAGGAALSLWGDDTGGYTYVSTSGANLFARPSRAVTVENNDFAAATNGRAFQTRLGVDNSTITVRNNLFRNSGVAANPATSIDTSSTGYIVRNYATGTLDIRDNAWGSSAGPSGHAGAIYGPVTKSRWIASYTDDPTKAGLPGFWPTAISSYEVPSNTVAPALSGTARVGSSLTTNDGTWSGSPAPSSYGYKWQRSDDGTTGWADISGATSASYEATSADFGKYLRSVVTATSTVGSDTATSAASAQVAALPTSTSVSSSGTINRGQSATFTVTVSPSDASGTVTVKDGSTSIGTCTLSSGSCTVTKKFLVASSRTITAEYAADAHFAASTSDSITQTVDSGVATIDVAPTGGDYSTIQAAINAAVAGDTIQIAAGTYTENVSLTKQVHLRGPNASSSPVGSGLTPAWSGGQAVVKATSSPVISISGAAGGSSIKGLSITSTYGSTAPTTGYGPVGISAAGAASDITVQNNYLYELYNHGVHQTQGSASSRVSNWTVESNLVTLPDPWGVYGSSYATEITGVFAWYTDGLTLAGNKIDGYGRGVQLDTNANPLIKNNAISNIVYHAIQAANGQTNAVIRGNTIDRAQLSSAWVAAGYPAWYCTGAIRLWTVSTSSGFVVENNKITNTGGDYPGECPAITAAGTNTASISSIKNNSIAGSPGIGFGWTAVQVATASLTGNVATVETVGGHALNVGDTVTIANLGASFDGSYTVTAKPDAYTFSYAKTAANVASFNPDPINGATALKSSQVGAITLGQNWWGSANGPGSTGASINAAGAGATAAPWTVAYSDGAADEGFDGNLGFWPTATTASAAPANTAAPVLSGTATVGETLSATDGTWTGSPTPVLTRKWQRSDNGTSGWTDVSGETASSYQLKAGDLGKYFRVVVTGTSAAGVVSENTSASSQVARPTTVHVATTGSNTAAATSASPLATIQAGVDLVASGGTVNVAAGTYNANVSVSKQLTLKGPNSEISPNSPSDRSAANSARVAEAVINGTVTLTAGGGSPRGSDGAAGSTVSGFRFTGSGKGVEGNGTNPPNNVTVTKNLFQKDGEAVWWADNSAPGASSGGRNWTITDNRAVATTASNNDSVTALFGYYPAGGATITDNAIIDYGRAIQLPSSVSGSFTIKDNLFKDIRLRAIQIAYPGANENVNAGDTPWGAGSLSFTIDRNTFSGNNWNSTSDNSGVVRVFGSVDIPGMTVAVTNNLFSNSDAKTTNKSAVLWQGDWSSPKSLGADGKLTVTGNRFNLSSGRFALSYAGPSNQTIPMTGNAWGTTDGTAIAAMTRAFGSTVGSTVNTAPTNVTFTVAPWLVEYTDDPTKAGQPGFWPTSSVGSAAPVNTVAPVLSGTAAVAETLSTTAGTWTGSPTPVLSYKWQRSADGTSGWTDISGATASSYQLKAADIDRHVRAVVVATSGAGVVTAETSSSTKLARPSTLFVATTGDDDTNTGVSSGSPVKTVQRGLDLVAAGGTVNVAAGTYGEDVTVAKRITLKGSTSGTSTIAGTSGGSAAVTVNAASGSSDVTIQDLAVTAASGKKGIDVTAENTKLTGLSVGGSGTVGIDFSGANLGGATDGSFVRNIAVGSGFSTAGVQVAGSGTLKILLSSFANTTSAGVPAVKNTTGSVVDARDNWWSLGGTASTGGVRPDNGVLLSGPSIDDSRWIRSYTADSSGQPGFRPSDVVTQSPPPPEVLAANPSEDRPVVAQFAEQSVTTPVPVAVPEPALQSPVIIQEPVGTTAPPSVPVETEIKLVVEPTLTPTTGSFSASGAPEAGSKFINIEFQDVVTDEKVDLDGPFTVCLVATSVSDRLWHFEGGEWVDITNRQLDGGADSWGARDTSGGRICGQVAHFSPFGVAPDTYAAPPVITGTTPTSDTTPTFTFDGEVGASFSCSLNGASAAACTTPYTVASPLADGLHELRVTQTDPAGNVSDVAIFDFEVDTVAPDAPGLELFTPATATASVPDTGSSTSSTSARVEFSSIDVDTVTYECRVDGGSWVSCESPFTGAAGAVLTGLSDGVHTVEVRQIDEADNESPASTVSWRVDTTDPGEVTFSSPSGWTATADDTHRKVTAETFKWTLPSDSGSSLSTVCSLDGGPEQPCTGTTLAGHSISALTDGPHSLTVTVVDAAGNRSAGTTLAWTTDTDVPESPDLSSNRSGFTQSTDATVTFSGEAGATFACELNGITYTPCSSPVNLSGLDDGDVTFEVTQTDRAGNVSDAATVTWNVDTTDPDFSPDLQSSREGETNWRSASLTWGIDDGLGSDAADVRSDCRLWRVNPQTGSGSWGPWGRCSSGLDVKNLPYGAVKFEVKLTDQAGNESVAQQVEWTVVRLAVTSPPSLDVDSRDNAPVGDKVTADDPVFSGEGTDNTDAIRWERCSSSSTSSCSTIPGTTGTPLTVGYNEYTPTSSDVTYRIRYVVVRTTDDGASVTTASDMSGVVVPKVQTGSAIAGLTASYDGAAGVQVPGYGRTLTATPVVWTNASLASVTGLPTLYRWQRCTDSPTEPNEYICKTISGANGLAATYKPTSSDVGRRLRLLTGVCISGTCTPTSSSSKFVWSATAVTEPVKVVAENVTDPSLSFRGSLTAPKRLSSVSVKAGAWKYTLSGKVTYQWQRCSTSSSSSCTTNISGATRSSYVPVSADVGSRLRVRVRYTGRDGTAVTVHTALSGPTAG